MENEFDLGFDMGDEETFVTLPEMQIPARCDKIERRDSKDGTFKNLFWTFVITEGDFTNKSPREYCTHLKPDTPHIGFLRACAALRPDLEQKGSKFKPSDYVGRKCLLDIKHEEYNERTYARIGDTLPLGSDSPKTAAPPQEKTSAEGAEEATFGE